MSIAPSTDTSLVLNRRLVARVLRRLVVNTQLSPVARAAQKHERALRRLFMQAVHEAQDAVPMQALIDVLSMGHSGTGAPLYVLQPVVDMMLEETPREIEHRPYMRVAATKKTVSSVLSDAMASGAAASEVCVLESAVERTFVTDIAADVERTSAARVQQLADRLSADGLLGTPKVRMQNGPIIISKTLRSDTATGFAYKVPVKAVKTPYASYPAGAQREIVLRMDQWKVGLKTPEATFLHENGHTLDYLHSFTTSELKATWSAEASAYLQRVGQAEAGQSLGVRYYARALDETIAQGVSIHLGDAYGVAIKDADEFRAAFPETMKMLKSKLGALKS